jgi:pimeloyl-ACP methyl ester carboxylesterase
MTTEPVLPIALHSRDEGSGPAVLLLHGLGADHSVWNHQVGPLAKEFRVLAPDLRGHGRSALPEGSTLSFSEVIADLTKLLDDRGISAAHLVGLSAGAFVALSWALRTPARTRSLVLSAGATHCDAHTRAVGKSWAEIYREEGYDAYILRLVKDLYAPEWIEAHMDDVDRLRADFRQKDYRGPFLFGGTIASYDLRGRLSGMRVPTLVLQGMDDHVVDASHARLLRQTIGGTQVRLFALTGHMVPVERPEETTQAIREWVHNHEGAGAPPGTPAPPEP